MRRFIWEECFDINGIIILRLLYFYMKELKKGMLMVNLQKLIFDIES